MRRGAIVAALLLASGCSPLKTFDAVVAKDGGGRRAAMDVAYGGDARQRLDIYAPSGAGYIVRPRPIAIFFYGGSWSSGTRSGYAFVGRALAAAGFVTVIPDYRLVPRVRYPAFVEDGAAAVRWVEAHGADYGGDPRRIVLVGHSAGAYIAAMLAVDDRWLGRDRDAVRGFVGIAGPYDFAPFDVAASRAAFGAWPRPSETQPVTWAGAGDPPTLLLVGGRDHVVSPRNSDALAARLNRAGVNAKIIRYPAVGHAGMVTAIARPLRGRAPVLADLAAFARRVTGE